ncbi:MAG: aminomethyl-transferring glycine dehydrogenase subunit GcvPB [Nitrospinae bacterium]|nr:aminomethyl-transferring glycine dehydrogenase subunit GcvPB [Nitrospinota bacterium]
MENKDFSEAQPGLGFSTPLIFEQGRAGRTGFFLPLDDLAGESLDIEMSEKDFRPPVEGMPELSEAEVTRHYTRLAQQNMSVDSCFYPLGSCTMKYNPKINEDACSLPGFASVHPYQPERLAQGCLQLMHELAGDLAEISGMDEVSLQPAAGAHGELAGMLIIRAYLESKGEKRKKVLLPDSAHGTNPASSALCGYEVVELKSNAEGLLDPEAVAGHMSEDVAALMLTNPNTLGLFEENIKEICRIVHQKGGLVYCDGANLNALMGIARIGDMGVDVLHFNLHKTFSTPHGGGGPGAGPVGVKKDLSPFLPIPVVQKKGDLFSFDYDRPKSIGRLKSFYGNFGVLVRAYAYIRSMGPEGLREASENAILNANYIRAKLKGTYHLPYERTPLHETVFSDKLQAEHHISTLDIAKALMDYGFHPPTIYFPLIVKGAIMIEPTETETRETLDRFIAAMKDIDRMAREEPETLKSAPHMTSRDRLDETLAARKPRLCCGGQGEFVLFPISLIYKREPSTPGH